MTVAFSAVQRFVSVSTRGPGGGPVAAFGNERFSIGELGGVVGPSSRLGDALALLTGDWQPDQMSEATVREVSPFGYAELEIRMRTLPKDATGYRWAGRRNHLSQIMTSRGGLRVYVTDPEAPHFPKRQALLGSSC